MKRDSDGKDLVIDDSPLIRDVIGEFLRDCGHTVVTAATGKPAWRSLGRNLPTDLTDIFMPRWMV